MKAPAFTLALCIAASLAGSPAVLAQTLAPRAPASGPAGTPVKPGDVQPANPVRPQINLPLGRTPPPPAPHDAVPGTRRPAPASPGIDDAVARCEALKGKAERAECLSLLRASPGT
jgi:hypothetical protein